MIQILPGLVGFFLGSGITYTILSSKIKSIKTKLEAIEEELEIIEQTEERRVIIPIMRVTARIKALI